MKTRTLILLATAASQLLLAAARFLPHISAWFGTDPEKALASQVALHFTLLSVGLGLLLLKESSEAQGARDALLLRLPPTTIRLLRDDDFYARFRAEITSAQHFVNISYFSPRPPDENSDPVRRQYYSGLSKLVRRNGHVQFKRIVRGSRENERWISSQLVLFRGVANMSIAIIDDVPETESMGLALSVQVIDEKLSWLVALGSHEREARFRDLFIDNADAAVGLNTYFLRLWARSTVVLSNGQPTQEGQALLGKRNKATP
jgi:hypothetical protein